MKYGDAANSWFLGTNIPGKGPQLLIYFGGADNYFDLLDESAESGFPQPEVRVASPAVRMSRTDTGSKCPRSCPDQKIIVRAIPAD